jgi:hypothetical protein
VPATRLRHSYRHRFVDSSQERSLSLAVRREIPNPDGVL